MLSLDQAPYLSYLSSEGRFCWFLIAPNNSQYRGAHFGVVYSVPINMRVTRTEQKCRLHRGNPTMCRNVHSWLVQRTAKYKGMAGAEDHKIQRQDVSSHLGLNLYEEHLNCETLCKCCGDDNNARENGQIFITALETAAVDTEFNIF